MKLQNIMIERLDNYKKLLEKYDIRDYGKLDYYINVLKVPELQEKGLIEKLNKVKKHLDSKVSKSIVLPKFECYENSVFSKELLDSIDDNTPSILLPYKLPSENHTTILAKNQPLTVKDLRYELQYVDERDRNVFNTRNTKKETIVVDSLSLYDEFIDELLKYSIKNNLDINSYLFFNDKELKNKIVMENRKEIAFNMLTNSDRFVFGEVSDKTKDTMFYNICRANSRTTKEFVDMISNYSIFEELDKNPTNPKVLKRISR